MKDKIPDLIDLRKKTDVNKKQSSISNKLTSNQAKHIEAGKNLNDVITSCRKLMNNLTRKISQISTKDNSFLLHFITLVMMVLKSI